MEIQVHVERASELDEGKKVYVQTIIEHRNGSLFSDFPSQTYARHTQEFCYQL